MAEAKNITAKDWLKDLASSTTSTEMDSRIMEKILRRLNFPNAVVVTGVVYYEGKGTLEFPPTSIHSAAKMLLEIAEKQAKAKGTTVT